MDELDINHAIVQDMNQLKPTSSFSFLISGLMPVQVKFHPEQVLLVQVHGIHASNMQTYVVYAFLFHFQVSAYLSRI
jgi:hypothetical protein